jgi:hypothetical protein
MTVWSSWKRTVDLFIKPTHELVPQCVRGGQTTAIAANKLGTNGTGAVPGQRTATRARPSRKSL